MQEKVLAIFKEMGEKYPFKDFNKKFKKESYLRKLNVKRQE